MTKMLVQYKLEIGILFNGMTWKIEYILHLSFSVHFPIL
jgi:hypothetical protein